MSSTVDQPLERPASQDIATLMREIREERRAIDAAAEAAGIPAISPNGDIPSPVAMPGQQAPTSALYLVANSNEDAPHVAAEMAISPLLAGGQTVRAFTAAMFTAPLQPDALGAALAERAAAVSRGDMTDVEAMLITQATSLDAIFNRLAFKAARADGPKLDSMERYMRLALKAQAQSSRTLEALAAVRNPTIFARQANVNMGGQQQVNNDGKAPAARRAPAKKKAKLNSTNELSRQRAR